MTMGGFVETPCRAFTAGGAIAKYLRVKSSSTLLAAAGALEREVGVTEQASFASGDEISVRLNTAQGTCLMTASGVISAEAIVYGAASGKISATANGNALGIALEAATADGDVIEVLRGDVPAEATGDAVPTVWGSGGDAEIMWSTGDASNHTLVLALGDSNQALHVTDLAAVATDWNVAADTHPTVYIHSNTTPATDYVKIGAHDGTNCWGADMVGGGVLKFGFDGLEALILSETATAVNEITIANAATGNNPSIACTGEADTGITFQNSEGEEILILDSVATSVNELTIRSAATGNKPIIAATGEADNGIEFHNDQAEQMLILASAATSVNELTITSAATGAAPSLAATGGDTNVTLALNAKGSGAVRAGGIFTQKMTSSALIDTATVTAAQLLTKVLDGTPTAAATYTLPTAALLVAAIPGCQVGDSFTFIVNNKSAGANTITVAGGAGSTDDGTLTVAQHAVRIFVIMITNVTGSSEAYNLYGHV